MADTIASGRAARRDARAKGRAKAKSAPRPKPSPEDLARRFLIVGNIHLQNDRPAKAKENYQSLLRKYPKSQYSQQAREKLSKMDSEG